MNKRLQKHQDYDFNVFINCPFDEEYKPLFYAIIYSIHACGFIARCAQEASTQTIRLTKILDIVGECRYGIHDLSRIDLTKLPRHNMPFELGIFVGCRHFGGKFHNNKEYLVLDSEPHRYKQHTSDLSGEDISIHGNKPQEVIRCVRDWLVYKAPINERHLIQSATILFERFTFFDQQLDELCQKRRLVKKDLLFLEYVEIVTDWIVDERKKMEDFDKIAKGRIDLRII